MDYDEVEREWCEAFDTDEGSIFTDDGESQSSNDDNEVGPDGSDNVGGDNDEDLLNDFTFPATKDDYQAEVTLLFSATQMEKLKKEKALVERRKKDITDRSALIVSHIQKSLRLTSHILQGKT